MGRSPNDSPCRACPWRSASRLDSARDASCSSWWYARTGSVDSRGVDIAPPPVVAPPWRLAAAERVAQDQVAELVQHPPERLLLDREVVEVRRRVEEVDRVQRVVPDGEFQRVDVVAQGLGQGDRVTHRALPEPALRWVVHPVPVLERGPRIVADRPAVLPD